MPSDKKSELKSVRVRWLLLRYKIAPIFSGNCLQQKLGPCALTSVWEKIMVMSSYNGTSLIIVTHNSSDKKSVRVRWLQSEKKSWWCHPTMGPHLLLSHTIAPTKNRSVCADFWSEKKSVRFFSELLATKYRSCVLTQSEKNADLCSDFFSELLSTKNRSVCAGH